MVEDLHLVGLQYNIAVAILFIPYCLVEAPSNILLRIFRPSRWSVIFYLSSYYHTVTLLILFVSVPFIMVVWGMVMALMCLVKTYQGLVMSAIRVIRLYFYSN
jgi:hypothetical protein